MSFSRMSEPKNGGFYARASVILKPVMGINGSDFSILKKIKASQLKEKNTMLSQYL